MKYKFLPCIVLLLVGLFVPLSYSANPTYTCTLTNDVKTASNVYEFDIYLLRTGTTPFELVQFQGGVIFNNAIKNGGTLTVSYVSGSSDASLVTSGQVNSSFDAATPGVIKIAPKLPAGGPGTGAVISAVAPGTKIGRLRLTNSVVFASFTPNIKFSNNPTVIYAIKIFANLAGNSTEITDTTQHFVTLANLTLPVERTSFVSDVSGRKVNLSWETKTEVNARQFEIDRALLNTAGSSATWSTVGVMKAAGTSVSVTKYSYTDKNLQAGKYQYRLKMIDDNGSFIYSSIESAEVAIPKDFTVSQNYPNPFNPTTKIDYQVPVDSKVVMEVYNVAGQKLFELVNKEQSAGYYTVDFGSSVKLASGVYIYRIVASDKATGNNFSSIKKMMLLK
jgi:hypothetical protein